MYHRERRKMKYLFIYAVLTLTHSAYSKHAGITTTDGSLSNDPVDHTLDNNLDNNIIDFEEDYSLKFNKKHGTPWHSNDIYHKQSHRYTIVNEDKTSDVESKVSVDNSSAVVINNDKEQIKIVEDTTPVSDLSSIPIELISTTENVLVSILDSTTEEDLTVIPLSTTKRTVPEVEISETVTLPSSTQSSESFTDSFAVTTENINSTTVTASSKESTTAKREITSANTEREIETTTFATTTEIIANGTTTAKAKAETTTLKTNTESQADTKNITTLQTEALKTNSSKQVETIRTKDSSSEVDVPVFTELDAEDKEVPEDYYDSKDVIPTTAPKTDALSVIFGLAGSVVESVVGSVAERVVPKGIVDLFRRMQRQSEALESERLRSREENGGLGQFGRGILKSISSGLSRPLSQLMAGVRDFGSLDTDRGFISSLATGVSSVANVANSVVDSFKDRVQAIYPGTVWCGDGHSPQARSSDLGLFFFTDTCCRQHDACKIYILSGETKYGLTNTGLFTRSHCGCDSQFRECLKKTSSLVSAQIGLTYFNVLGPQCFRKAHPIVRCVRRTRITGQKCEEYELDFTKPKMWQWFDNETF